VARALVTLRERQRDREESPAETGERGRLAEYLEGLDDAEVRALNDELRPAAGGGAGAAADGGAAEPD
jgi:hypothetical protein